MSLDDSGKALIAGGVSGLVVRFVISPLDVVKIRLQLARLKGYKFTAFSVSKDLLRQEGTLAFWKGNLPAELMYLIYGGVQFGAYKFTQSTVGQGYGKELLCGGISGCAATITSYPLDTIRTRLAADQSKGFQSLSKSIKNIYQKESVKGFYDGLKPSLYQVFIQTALSFWAYDKLKQLTIEYKDSAIIPPVSGFLAGCFSKGVTYPLDSVKRRLQIKGSQLENQKQFEYIRKYNQVYKSQNVLKILSKIIEVEGIRSLYRGFSMAILKSGPASSLSFTVYEACMSLMKDI